MKRPAAKIFKVTGLAAMGIVLMVAGLLTGLYSFWFQNEARESVVKAMNSRPGTEFALNGLRISFPLKVSLDGLLMVQDGDTMIRARAFEGNVRLLPLLAMNVDVEGVRLSDARYQMGTRDSATCVVVSAGSVRLDPASVRLSPLKIDVEHATMADGLVDIYINPCPPPSPANTTPPSPLNIDARTIDLHNFTFRMNMMPTIDSLGVHMDYARMSGGKIDIVKQTVDVSDFSGHGMRAAYIVPDSAQILATKVAPADTAAVASEPWTVRVGRVDFDSVDALYTTHGYTPMAGMDFAYIQLKDGHLAVNNFFNRATDVTVPLQISGTERCGVSLVLDGTLKVSATRLDFEKVRLTTPGGTNLSASGMMGVGNPVEDTSLPLGINAEGELSCADLALMFPFLSPYFAGLHPGTIIDATLDADGSMARLDIETLALNVPNSLRLDASGQLSDIMSPDRMGGDISLSGRIGDLSPWRKILAQALGEIRIPPLSLDGDVRFAGGNYSGNIDARTAQGRLALDGDFHGNAESYDLTLVTDNFPVDAFMPTLGVGNLTADISATGHGFNLFSNRTTADATIDLRHVVYNRQALDNISGTARLADGYATINLDSHNPGADISLAAEGNLSGETYEWTVQADSRKLDLHALGLSLTPMEIEGSASLKAAVNAKRPTILRAELEIPSMVYTDSVGPLRMNDISATLNATDSMTCLMLNNGDLRADFDAYRPLDSLMTVPGRLMTVLRNQMDERRINIDQLQDALPEFTFVIEGGDNNIVSEYLSQMNTTVRSFEIKAYNDTVFSLDASAEGITSGQTKVDSLFFDVRQDGNRLNYTGSMRNRPGTFDEWASADIKGYFRPGRLGLNFEQRNIRNKTGFEFGAYVDLNPDSTATLHFSPLDPTIGFQQWLVNEDNFVRYDFVNKHVDANLKMRSDISSVDIYTENLAADVHDHSKHDSKENLIIKLSDIRIQDWITLNPFAPAIKGNVSADLKFNYHDGKLMANGDMTLGDLLYGRERVGDFKADIDMQTSPGGVINADVALWVNGHKSLTLNGALNDSTRTSPFLLDMTLIHLPLSTVNAFMPGVARLEGTLNGRMDVSGDMKAPRLDGFMQFDSTAVRVNMLGTTFRLSSDSVPVRDNKLRLNDFAITACNENPLYINGSVDIRSLEDIGLDLSMKASNMQIVKSQRATKGAEVYGRAFIDLDATARGSLSFLDINARGRLNSGTNVTYIMTDAEDKLQSQSDNNMVRFVNFNDSTAVADADSLVQTGMTMNLNALLTIQSGTTISVDLDAKGQNKAQILGEGTLNYTQTPLEETGRLTGRLNINGGFVRYGMPPVMSQKTFDLQDGSYVAFSGDILDPALNLHAVDQMRANVTQEGQNSRLVNFDVSVGVTGSLSNMNVVFDLSTGDDVTIANELQSMSPSQRASEAMNMLLYNMYTGPGTKANANLSGNPLYSFLTSQINSWAANTIKGVDLSFGINQFDRTDEGISRQTTQYSYKVSKSLFNDRFKVSVGGNYSTDTQPGEEVANNLFNDISMEYLLNKAGTMYVKVFRKTGFESILEGEITSTGVGFVYRRKISRLGDMFRFRRRKRLQQTIFNPEEFTPAAPATSAEPAAPARSTGPDTATAGDKSIPSDTITTGK